MLVVLMRAEENERERVLMMVCLLSILSSVVTL